MKWLSQHWLCAVHPPHRSVGRRARRPLRGARTRSAGCTPSAPEAAALSIPSNDRSSSRHSAASRHWSRAALLNLPRAIRHPSCKTRIWPARSSTAAVRNHQPGRIPAQDALPENLLGFDVERTRQIVHHQQFRRRTNIRPLPRAAPAAREPHPPDADHRIEPGQGRPGRGRARHNGPRRTADRPRRAAPIRYFAQVSETASDLRV